MNNQKSRIMSNEYLCLGGKTKLNENVVLKILSKYDIITILIKFIIQLNRNQHWCRKSKKNENFLLIILNDRLELFL